jgi:type IV pilus assembly protein PilQ
MIWMHARFMALWVAAAAAAFAQEASAPAGGTAAVRDFRQNYNFSNTDLRSAFKALATSGRIDIVVAPNVAGVVASLQLTDKTWQEALMVLCQMFNLKYTVERNYLYIQTMADYNKTSVENASATQANSALAPLMRDVIKLKNSRAKDLEESVKGLLSSRGKVNVVERNNALLVFDTRENLREIRAAVRELDVETYQVNIQSQLIQVDADALHEMGVDWQFAARGTGLTNLINNPGRLPTSSANNVVGQTNQGGQAGGSSAGTSSGGGTGSSGAGASGAVSVGGVAGATTAFAFGLLDGHIGVAVANLLKNASGEVLAKPQITTLDNTEARIFMGEQVPIRVLDENGRQAVQLQDAGTSLQVTPHVTSDGRVLLDLNPEKNSFRNDPGAGVVLQKQSARTSVLVNDGETVVIAGLTTKEESQVETGVPLLKDIPILGWLFKRKSTLLRKRDLIIFVTPHIVKTTGAKASVTIGSPPPEERQGEGAFGSAPEKPAEAQPAPESQPAGEFR